jgi:dolichol kinase
MAGPAERISDRAVLLVISAGLIVIILAIIIGIFTSPRALPNWAENVLVSIGTAAALKLGDCLATLIALSTGRSVERLGTQLGYAGAPVDPAVAGKSADPVNSRPEHMP